MLKFTKFFPLLFIIFALYSGFKVEPDPLWPTLFVEPVQISWEEAREAPELTTNFQLTNFSRFYIYKDYLLGLQTDLGVQFFDNSDPSDPQHLYFLEVIGCREIAIRNDFLYVDSFKDLLTIDLSQGEPSLVLRNYNAVYYDPLRTLNNDGYYNLGEFDPDFGPVIRWVEVDVGNEDERLSQKEEAQ